MKIIAHIYNDYTEKFGIPRQSGLNASLISRLVMEPDYRSAEAFRGLEAYSHLWLLWEFSEVPEDLPFSPTVRPPRLGGNTRVGVFATRSPFRPNRIGLSCVELIGMETGGEGPVLLIAGADLMNGTPVYDIKPYLPYTDSHPDARVNKALSRPRLSVHIPDDLAATIPPEKLPALKEMLALDPRPAYQEDPGRIYGVSFGSQNIKFRVEQGLLYVTGIQKI